MRAAVALAGVLGLRVSSAHAGAAESTHTVLRTADTDPAQMRTVMFDRGRGVYGPAVVTTLQCGRSQREGACRYFFILKSAAEGEIRRMEESNLPASSLQWCSGGRPDARELV